MTLSRLRDVLTFLLMIGIGAGMGSGTIAAWSDATDTTGRIKTGTVVLSSDASGGAVFTVAGATPATAMTKCVVVSYDGTLTARVRLSGTVSGALAQHLTLEVVRGTKAPASGGDCTGFDADDVDHAGLGAGVVWRGALSSFPGAGTPIIDPEDWTEGEDHAYQLRLTLASVEAAQGLSAAMAFTWEAESL